MESEKIIKGRVERILYQNDETGYTVLRLKPGTDEVITMHCTTAGAVITEGVDLVARGTWDKHPKYGRQFAACSVEPDLPTNTKGIVKYLTSGLIEGVGARTARRLADAFGDRLWYVLNNEQDSLYTVAGIKKGNIDKLIKSWGLQRRNNEAMVFLQKFDVGPQTAVRIIRKYGKSTISTVKDNPYILADEVDGIGFKRADVIAQGMGYAKDGDGRIRAGLSFYIRERASSAGDMFQYADELVKEVSKLLDVDSHKVESVLNSETSSKTLINDHHGIFLPSMHNYEAEVAKVLVRLLKSPCGQISVPDNLGGSKIEYDDVQMDAIRKAMESKVMVLTGGPGTGKTTTTNGIIKSWEKSKLKILLAAPTGRAAKRMGEATGKDASTIHRLLEYTVNEDFQGFARNASNPLEGDALIIDEASMIDTELMFHLLAAVPSRMRLVLVGDVDQLPSVGPGNVLRDIIDSGVIPVVRLTRIFRQAQTSKIVTNAHRINQGEMPEIDNTAKSDFFVLPIEDASVVGKVVCDLVVRRLPAGYGVSPSDIQVLSPMRKSSNGVNQLNTDLQSLLNPHGNGITSGRTTFRVYDRVMQTRNDYKKHVFNGDTGYIVDVDSDAGSLFVDFGDGVSVEYERSDLKNLQLSYTTTIHKSQGSEYPVVVIPLTTQFAIMLQRNLLYTAVTRAKKVCVIVGQKKALSMAVRNKSIQKRNTMLKERLISENEEYYENAK